jgi:hypothetical protein
MPMLFYVKKYNNYNQLNGTKKSKKYPCEPEISTHTIKTS